MTSNSSVPIVVKGYSILVKVNKDIIHRQLKKGERVEGNNIITESGFIVETYDDEVMTRGSNVGEVMQIGDMAYKTEGFTTGAWCEVGDTVFFKRYQGVSIDGSIIGVPGDKYMILNDTDILAVINNITEDK